MSLIERLDEKEIDYWDFSNVVSTGIHKISAYPATMVPDMQNELIRLIKLEDASLDNILDPFHGSGVTMVEGVKNNLTPIGIDVNPLANLITLVKLQGISKKQINRANKEIVSKLIDDDFKFDKHYFYNIEKWYRKDFIDTFSKIRCAIQQEKIKNIRQYYWVCLINILKKYSNSRTSTFKLHIKAEDDINSMVNRVIEEFKYSILNFYEYLPTYDRKNKFKLFIGQSESILRDFKDESVDLICTSPPYGDNSTTVTYGQYSVLPLFWIDQYDLCNFDEKLIKNYSSIDSNSLGGVKKLRSHQFHSNILEKYLASIDSGKRKKVENFILDYIEVMSELRRVLKKNKYIVLTLGNRRVDNKIVPLSDITQEYFEKNGFTLEKSIIRNIPKKRMPRKVSRVAGDSVESMNREYILILKKVTGIAKD